MLSVKCYLIHVSIMFYTNMPFLYKYCVHNLKNDIGELKRELDVQTCQENQKAIKVLLIHLFYTRFYFTYENT